MSSGERVRQERIRQGLSRKALAERAKVHEKTVQRIEGGQRDTRLFMVEQALGLAPSSSTDGDNAYDEDEVLRRTSHRRFWLEAARRASELADLEQLPRGQIADIPTGQLPNNNIDEAGEPDTPGASGGR